MKSCFFLIIGGCLGYLITATDWSQTYLGQYMQGQEKLTFIVILSLFSITLCCTLISANEKPVQSTDSLEEPTINYDVPVLNSFLPIDFMRYLFQSVSNSVKTIFTMPLALRRLTLAECCSW